MNKYLLHTVAVLLIPCLLLTSVEANVFAVPPSSRLAGAVPSESFQEQAIPAQMLNMIARMRENRQQREAQTTGRFLRQSAAGSAPKSLRLTRGVSVGLHVTSIILFVAAFFVPLLYFVAVLFLLNAGLLRLNASFLDKNYRQGLQTLLGEGIDIPENRSYVLATNDHGQDIYINKVMRQAFAGRPVYLKVLLYFRERFFLQKLNEGRFIIGDILVYVLVDPFLLPIAWGLQKLTEKWKWFEALWTVLPDGLEPVVAEETMSLEAIPGDDSARYRQQMAVFFGRFISTVVPRFRSYWQSEQTTQQALDRLHREVDSTDYGNLFPTWDRKVTGLSILLLGRPMGEKEFADYFTRASDRDRYLLFYAPSFMKAIVTVVVARYPALISDDELMAAYKDERDKRNPLEPGYLPHIPAYDEILFDHMLMLADHVGVRWNESANPPVYNPFDDEIVAVTNEAPPLPDDRTPEQPLEKWKVDLRERLFPRGQKITHELGMVPKQPIEFTHYSQRIQILSVLASEFLGRFEALIAQENVSVRQAMSQLREENGAINAHMAATLDCEFFEEWDTKIAVMSYYLYGEILSEEELLVKLERLRDTEKETYFLRKAPAAWKSLAQLSKRLSRSTFENILNEFWPDRKRVNQRLNQRRNQGLEVMMHSAYDDVLLARAVWLTTGGLPPDQVVAPDKSPFNGGAVIPDTPVGKKIKKLYSEKRIAEARNAAVKEAPAYEQPLYFSPVWKAVGKVLRENNGLHGMTLQQFKEHVFEIYDQGAHREAFVSAHTLVLVRDQFVEPTWIHKGMLSFFFDAMIEQMLEAYFAAYEEMLIQLPAAPSISMGDFVWKGAVPVHSEELSLRPTMKSMAMAAVMQSSSNFPLTGLSLDIAHVLLQRIGDWAGIQYHEDYNTIAVMTSTEPAAMALPPMKQKALLQRAA